jgi:DNA modification methylase
METKNSREGDGVILHGDALTVLKTLESKSVNMCVTSPPYYGLRDYGVDGQIGLEDTPEQYIARLVDVFREVRRVLRDDGTLWLNIGDSYNGYQKGSGGTGKMSAKQNSNKGANYAVGGQPLKMDIKGLKHKDLIGIPWMLAFALRADGWYLRQDIIWHKPNPMPESVRDRCTKAHEYIFLLSKSGKYYYDREPIREPVKKGCDGTIRAISRERSGPVDVGNGAHISERVYNEIKGANKRSVWTIATKPFKGAHFATFPPSLITPCILAGCPEGGIVLDPFFGSGTTGEVAAKLMRKWIGIELNPKYIEIAERRTAQTTLSEVQL